MSETKKTNNVLLRIRENYQNHKVPINLVMIFVDILLLVYYLGLWIIENDAIWDNIYLTVNPFTIGAYIVGAVVLIHYVLYDSWFIKVLISAFYGMVMLLSLVLLMGTTRIWELLVYVPHLIIIILCGVVTCRISAASHNRAQNERK